METCFVIQPFDGAKYDKRYNDVFSPAIEAAGLTPYRVDKDPSVSIPIEAIEAGICKAVICLADITEDNPNVWYELGFAFANSIPTVMVCSEERKGKFPFDIQHRTIHKYNTESGSDFDRLREELVITLRARKEQDKVLRHITESKLVEPIRGLKPDEIKLLAVLARECSVVDSSATLNETIQKAERAGITGVAFHLAYRSLQQGEYITVNVGYPFVSIILNNKAWEWIEANKSQFA